MNFFDVLVQWIHVVSVAVAVGGMFLLRFVACPAMKQVFPNDESARENLTSALVRRFKIVVHAAVTLLLLSGGYLVWNAWPLVKQSPAYRHGIEVKILLALGVFFLSIMLTVTKPEPNFFQKSRDKWLTINFLLALLAMAVAAYLRMLH